MAYHFSANQYDDQYCPKKLGNWEYPKWFPERPRQRTKPTKFIAGDNGRLLDGVKRENPWGNFVATWDLPKRITREYVEKLAAPPERLLNIWGKKRKPQEDLGSGAQIRQESGVKPEFQDPCTMCGKPIGDCGCNQPPSQKAPSQTAPSQKAPSQTAPSQKAPSQTAPSQKASSLTAPPQPAPSQPLPESKSLDSSAEGVETCGDTLHCPKCNNEMCLCEDKCRCLVHN